jgi:hypothetical protein
MEGHTCSQVPHSSHPAAASSAQRRCDLQTGCSNADKEPLVVDEPSDLTLSGIHARKVNKGNVRDLKLAYAVAVKRRRPTRTCNQPLVETASCTSSSVGCALQDRCALWRRGPHRLADGPWSEKVPLSIAAQLGDLVITVASYPAHHRHRQRQWQDRMG